MGKVTQIDLARVRDDLMSRLGAWRVLVKRNVLEGRQLLKSILDGRLVLQPKLEDGHRLYEFSGRVVLGRLLQGVVPPKGVVAPTGFEPVFESRRAFASVVDDFGRV
jgi:hypothetical protein